MKGGSGPTHFCAQNASGQDKPHHKGKPNIPPEGPINEKISNSKVNHKAISTNGKGKYTYHQTNGPTAQGIKTANNPFRV